MMKKLAALALVILLILTAVSAAAEGQIRILPIDLSGGAPFKAKFADNREFYEDPTIRVDIKHMQLTDSPEYGRVYYFYALVTIQSA